LRRTLLILTVAAVVTGQAGAAITSSNYQALRVKSEKRIDHALDVARFFENHPKSAKSVIGKQVIRTQKAVLKWNQGRLDRVQRFVYAGDFLPPIWKHIAICEPGKNPINWKHDSGTYQGAFGFHYESWDDFNRFGYPSEAYLATPEQQYRVALAIHDKYGFTGWGCA